MHRVSEQQIPGSTNIPDWTGCEFYYVIKQKENMEPWFSWLLGWLQPAQNQIFCSLLTLNVKNTVHLGDGHTWLQLVESFSYLGLRLSGELLTVEPARGTGYQTNFKAA